MPIDDWDANSAWKNLECARGPQSSSGPHGKLGGKPLGGNSGRSLCGAAWSGGRDRTALGWKPLAALPRPLSAPAALPRSGAAVRKSFRPTASRTCGTNTETPKQKQNQIPCASRTPLEKTLEADISSLLKTGHFYFALTELVAPVVKHECIAWFVWRWPNDSSLIFSPGAKAHAGCWGAVG
jgi:hypothetical protein